MLRRRSPPAAAHRDPRGEQIAASRRAVHTGRLRDPPHRPAQAAESKNLLLLLMIQDVAHPGEGPWARRLRQRLGCRQLMAGFAVSINGWIWVSTEVRKSLPARKSDILRPLHEREWLRRDPGT